jgi:hypothetical protein
MKNAIIECERLCIVNVQYDRDADDDYPQQPWFLGSEGAWEHGVFWEDKFLIDAKDQDSCEEWLKEHDFWFEFIDVDRSGYLMDNGGYVTAWLREGRQDDPNGGWLVFQDADDDEREGLSHWCDPD